MGIVLPIAIVGGLGIFFGVILGISSGIFKVEKDEREEMVVALLPGANCGGCGYAGCSALAAAIAKGEAPVSACPVMSEEAVRQIADVMGKKVSHIEKQVAFVICKGSDANAWKKYEYTGISDCFAAAKIGGGDKKCSYGCLGYGTCVGVCKFDAISVKNGVAVVDREKCTHCTMCIRICPKKVIASKPYKNDQAVTCATKEKGATLKEICKVGCIGCKLCEKVCPTDAIHVIDNLAAIDYEKCINCGECALKCPKKLISLK